MLDEQIFDLQIAIFISTATVIFAIVCSMRRDLLKYLPSYVLVSLGTFFIYLQYFNYAFRLIGNIFFFFAAISLISAVYYEYYKIILKKSKGELINAQILLPILFLTSILTLTIILVQIILIILTSIASIMMLFIFLRTKTPVHLSILAFLISSALSLASTILSNFNMTGAWEFSYLTNIIYATILTMFPLIAYLEDRIIKSEQRYREAYDRASFYKDLVSHDINNVLQNIQTSSDLLSLYFKDPNKSEESIDINNVIKDQVKRGTKLVFNVRKISELEENKISLSLIDLCDLLKKAINYNNQNFPDREIIIQVETSYKIIKLLANELLLDVFENILINAVKHNNNQKVEVLIKISKTQKNNKDYFKLEFIDNGIGIPEQLKERIFQRAYQYTTNISGMGLGLTLVRKIIESYHGEIWVEDKMKDDPSRGSNFIILIPKNI